jgi:hypothetical protein
LSEKLQATEEGSLEGGAYNDFDKNISIFAKEVVKLTKVMGKTAASSPRACESLLSALDSYKGVLAELTAQVKPASSAAAAGGGGPAVVYAAILSKADDKKTEAEDYLKEAVKTRLAALEVAGKKATAALDALAGGGENGGKWKDELSVTATIKATLSHAEKCLSKDGAAIVNKMAAAKQARGGTRTTIEIEDDDSVLMTATMFLI